MDGLEVEHALHAPLVVDDGAELDRAGQQVAERVAQGLVAAHRVHRMALAAALPGHRPPGLVADEREGQAVVDRSQLDLARARERQALERAVGADEVLDEVVGGAHEQLRRGRVLGQDAALLEHRDAVAQLDRLVDVVGDEDDRLAQAPLQAQQLVLQALAVDRVDGAERLVHEHQRRVGGQGAGHADALALAAGELRGVAVARLGGIEPDELDELVDAGADALARPAQQRAARWRCSRRSSGAGRGRSAGSRSRSRGAARRAGACGPTRRRRRMSPLVISIMRLTRRIAVVLPQPDGPDEDADLAGRDLEAQILDRGLARALVGLGDVAELEGRRLRVRRLPLGVGGGWRGHGGGSPSGEAPMVASDWLATSKSTDPVGNGLRAAADAPLPAP